MKTAILTADKDFKRAVIDPAFMVHLLSILDVLFMGGFMIPAARRRIPKASGPMC